MTLSIRWSQSHALVASRSVHATLRGSSLPSHSKSTTPLCWCQSGAAHLNTPPNDNGSYCQRFYQRLGLLEVGGIKPLGEPAVHRREHLKSFGPLALPLPQASQAHGRAQ